MQSRNRKGNGLVIDRYTEELTITWLGRRPIIEGMNGIGTGDMENRQLQVGK